MTDLLPGLILVVIAAAIFLTSRRSKRARTPPAAGMADWRIGPVINGDNYSVGMPMRPTVTADGIQFDLPAAPGHVNYVQLFDPPPLRDALTLRFRFEGGPAYGAEAPSEPATVSLMMQRKGDKWHGEGFRFWSKMIPLVEGEHEVTVPLTPEHWGDMIGGTIDLAAFADVLRNPGNIGITLGSPSAPTHGAFGSGRITGLSLA